MADFPEKLIEIHYNTDNYGPFVFNLNPVTFTGDSIASANVRAFLGNVKCTDDLSEQTEVTALIDSDVAPSVNSNYVSVYFKYPGDDYKGDKFTLIFEVTYTNQTGVHSFFYQYLKVC